MPTNKTTTEDDGLGIPDALKRTEPPKASTPAVTHTATPAQKIAAKHNATVKPAKVAKPAKEAKPAKAKATHKPSTIKSTEDNPAKSIVPSKFKALYAEHDDCNGDKVALTLKSAIETVNKDGRTVLDMSALAKVAKDNGIDYSRYEHLNNGQKRMNVGNRLRGMLKAGKKVTIGKQTFANAEKALAKPAHMEHRASA